MTGYRGVLAVAWVALGFGTLFAVLGLVEALAEAQVGRGSSAQTATLALLMIASLGGAVARVLRAQEERIIRIEQSRAGDRGSPALPPAPAARLRE